MRLTDAYYESRYENEFRQTKGDAFQAHFEKLMGLAYKADFIALRPWGRDGDRKNDGFLKSERRLFQVYAPNEMDARTAKRKIREDFEGALQHWETLFDKWTFVHNATEGLPPHVVEILLRFEADHPRIHIEPWCLQELLGIFRKISTEEKASWLGFAPTEDTKHHLGFEDLRVVLETIATQSGSFLTEVANVPAGKIEANALSDAVARLLKEGMIKSPLVGQFLGRWHDETLGERLAQAFSVMYRSLRGKLSPNEIFSEMQSWAGGNKRGSAEHELAVITVLAYYFERCDIFEEPPGSA